MSQLHKMQLPGKPMPHLGNLMLQVMKQKGLSQVNLAAKMGLSPSGIYQYSKQETMHAALLWKLGEVLEYNFFAVLAEGFPVQTSTQLEQDLQQQVSDLTKENELYKNLLYGKLGNR